MVLNDGDVYSGEVRQARKSALMLWASEEHHQQVLETKSKRKGKTDTASTSLQPLGTSNRPNAKKGKSAGHKARARSSPAVPGSKPKAHKGQAV